LAELPANHANQAKPNWENELSPNGEGDFAHDQLDFISEFAPVRVIRGRSLGENKKRRPKGRRP
jgi:hypothetical protein